MTIFDESLYERKWYKHGELFFIKWFNFQFDIPNRKWKQKDTFPWIRSLLAYLKEKWLTVYITNKDLDRDYEMVWDGKFMVDIKKFVGYCHIMTSKASPKLAQGFFTHDIDVKNLTEDQKIAMAWDLSDSALIATITTKSPEHKIKIIGEIIEKLPDLEKEKLSIISTKLQDFSTETIVEEAYRRQSTEKEKYIASLCSSLWDDDFSQISQQNLSWKDFVNIAHRKRSLEVFSEHLEKNDWIEWDWQSFFENNSWIFWYWLDYRFIAIFDREMTVGNWWTSDQDKPKVDYLWDYWDFTVLVELKTPWSKIFVKSSKENGKQKNIAKNRAWSWRFSDVFIYAYSQVLEQRAEWIVQWNIGDNKSKDWSKKLEARTKDPKCILIFWNKEEEISSTQNISEKEIKQDTFELFRRDTGIEIIPHVLNP